MGEFKVSKLLYGSFAVVALFIVQVFAGKVGWAVADLLSYKRIDFYNTYARISVHHIIQMLIASAIIIVLSKQYKLDFGFKPGDNKKGMIYFKVFTAAYIIIALISHLLMYMNNQLPTYDFPLNKNNIIGTLSFQLLLSGPSEEILFRALPITVLIYAFGKSINIKWGITLEIIMASLLFSIAHIKWSLLPFTIDADYFQLFYAFVLGTVQGVVYQKSQSILYPILMHSISNFLMVGTGYMFTILK